MQKTLQPFSIVVAVAQNGVIGYQNTLPWRLPNDLAHFKKITLGHCIIMGRLTFESIGKPLPGRQNIVVTRQKEWRAEGVSVAHSLSEALILAHQLSDQMPMLIGGAQLYEQALPECSTLYLTRVLADVDGDAYFPEIDDSEWVEIELMACAADEKNQYAHEFLKLERVSS